jgi:hypothetical protein
MSAKNVETVVENGTEIFIPLNKLKKSPKNARKTPDSEAAIEAYAASIAAKGILQNLVAEPEVDADVTPTGLYFVTIGEGRRLAQLLELKVEIHAFGPVQADEPGMDRHVGILSSGARLGGRPAEVDRVLRDEGPIPFEVDRLQAPILQVALSEPHDMRGFAMSPTLRQLRHFSVETFVNQRLHSAFR